MDAMIDSRWLFACSDSGTLVLVGTQCTALNERLCTSTPFTADHARLRI
jgi:hypothetical protein